MADERRRSALTPAQLADMLEKLDNVMMEAARLRDQVTRQLVDQRRSQQQRLASPRRKTRPKKKR